MSTELFHVQLTALKFGMMWPFSNGNPALRIVNRLVLTVNSVVLGTSTVFLFIKAANTNDLVDRSEAMDIFTLTGSALYKMLFFYWKNDDFVEMMRLNSIIAPHIPVNWMKNAPFFTKFHCSAGSITLAVWGLCPVLKLAFGETSLSEMKLPMNVWDPFDSSGLLFCTFYVLCAYGLVLSAYIYMSADAYLFSSIHLVNGTLQWLSDTIKEMNLRFGNETKELPPEAHELLKDCIKIHIDVIKFIRKTDELFRSMIMADILHAIISLSFALLQTSESKGIAENMKMVVFMICCFVHQYLNSRFGQQLIDKQTDLNLRIITTVPWTEGSKFFRKTYLLMVTNSETPIKLSAWSVYKLQYSTFAEFVKSMISYYMVLRTLQDEAVDQI